MNASTHQQNCAYDYETQKWVASPSEIVRVRRKQLTDEIDLLTGPKAAEFVKFSGCGNIENAIATCRRELAAL